MDISATELCLMLEEVLAQGDVDAVIITKGKSLVILDFRNLVGYSCRVNLVTARFEEIHTSSAHQAGNL